MACYGDDKYAKFEAQHDRCERLHHDPWEAFGVLSMRGMSKKDVAFVLRSPFLLYTSFLMLTGVSYYTLGGRLGQASEQDKLAMVSTVAETVGLLMLRGKIECQGKVAGISGMTVAMYALVYVLRQVILIPPASWFAINGWAVEVLQLPSMFIVFDVLRAVFVTHRRSYQEDLDVLQMKYLVPACVVLALVICPQFPRGPLFSFFQTVYLYLDMVALLPQVVMMAHGGGKVEAPIAHFVAATALRELVDLWFWIADFDLGPQGYYQGFNYSGWICLLCQVVSVALVADFMYYYFKARLSGAALSDAVALPDALDV